MPIRTCVMYREARAGHRLLGCLLRGDHYRQAAHPGRLDSLPLGGQTFPQTMTYWCGPLITFNTKITHLSEALSSPRGVCCECNLQKDAVRPTLLFAPSTGRLVY